MTLASWIKVVIAGLITALSYLCIYAAMQPEDYAIVRSTVIDAPVDVVEPLIDDLRQWPQWSPWAHQDRNIQYEYEGPAKGKGSTQIWNSSKFGSGKIQIQELNPQNYIRYRLTIFKWETVSDGQILLRPQDQSTSVTWTMAGRNRLLQRVIWTLTCMEKFIGSDFEKGLSHLKSLAEKNAANSANP